MKTLISILLISVMAISARAASEPILFRGVVTFPGDKVFSISTPDEGRYAWVSIGDSFVGYTITEYAADEEVIVIQQGDQEWRIPLGGRSRGLVEDDNVVSVSTLGFFAKPGKVEIRAEKPTLLDVWKSGGGAGSDAGNRLIITRTGEDGVVERQEITLPFDSPGPELDEKLKRIPLQDRDVLFFQKGAE